MVILFFQSFLKGLMKNKTSIHLITSLDEASFSIDSATLTPGEIDSGLYGGYEIDAFDELMDSPEKQDQIADLMVAFVNEKLEISGQMIVGELFDEM
jgi:hypothetical protein